MRGIRSLEVLLLAALVAGPLFAGQTLADVPDLSNYQGLLLDPNGNPLNATVDVTLRIYNDPNSVAPGNLLYEEVHLNVPVIDGVFDVKVGLGDVTSGPFNVLVFLGANRWLEIGIDSETLVPRQQYTSVAYSFQSQVCVNAAALEGEDLAGVISAAQTGLATQAQLLGHAADPNAHHDKTMSFAELTDQASDGQIPSGIARDSEVLALLLLVDGDTSLLDADFLDGLDSSAFAQSADVFGIVLDNDGAGSGLIADMLDGVHAIGFLRSNADDSFTASTLTIEDGSSLVVEDSMTIGPATVTTTNISDGDANNTVRFAGANLIMELGDSSADDVFMPGEVIAGGPLTLTSGSNRYLPVPAAEFSASHASSGEEWYYSTGFGFMQGGSSPWAISLTAPVDLPDDSTIEALRCYWYDNAGGGVNLNLDVTLYRREYTSTSNESIAFVGTDIVHQSTNVNTISDITMTLGREVVDTNAYQYFLWVFFDTDTGAPFNELRFYGCKITYSGGSFP